MIKLNTFLKLFFKEKKKHLLFHLLVIIFFLPNSMFAQPFSRAGKPNIVFILVDDMGWNGISSFGNKHVSTPNIDRLAEQGMRFTQAYVAPECTPTRAEFLSGQYGARTGITQVHHARIYPNAPLITPRVSGKLPNDNHTVANMLKDAGYATAISGKWHIGDGYTVAALKEKHGNQYFEPYGFDFIGDAEEKKRSEDYKEYTKKDKEKASMEIVNDFRLFIKQYNNQPFFAYLSFFSAHTPILAPDSLSQEFLKRGYSKTTSLFGDGNQIPTANYVAMIKYLDHTIGELLAILEKKKISDNTIVVFTSDNGGLNRAWNNCPLRGAKGTLYEGGIRVPMIVRWPAEVPAGSESSIPVHIVDMFATFRVIAGGINHDSKILDGINLLPVLTQQGKPGQRALFWHHPHYIHDYGKTPSSAIRKGDYKLIYYFGDYLYTKGHLPQRGKPFGFLQIGDRIELFNIEEDPNEQNDLSEELPEKTEELMNLLEGWWMETNAPLPQKNPAVNMSKWENHIRRN